MDPIAALMRQAAEGRGCWIGLFTSRKELAAIEGTKYTNSDPHLTLAHMGRKVTESQMRELSSAASDTADNSCHLLAITHGYARFRGGRDGDPLVHLIRGEHIHATHELLVRQLRQRNIGYDDRFGFLPHITVARCPGVAGVNIEHAVAHSWIFDRITLVCGDVRVPFEMKPLPF